MTSYSDLIDDTSPDSLKYNLINGILDDTQSKPDNDHMMDLTGIKRHDDTDLLVLNFLIHTADRDAAAAFAKEIGFPSVAEVCLSTNRQGWNTRPTAEQGFDVGSYFDPETIKSDIASESTIPGFKECQLKGIYIEKFRKVIRGISTIGVRSKIKSALVSGNVDQAYKILADEFPEIIDGDRYIYFSLMHLALTEKIRGYFTREALISDDKERSVYAGSYLDEVLKFIKTKLSIPSIIQKKELLKTFEYTLTVLCFADYFEARDGKKLEDVPTPIRELMDIKRRDQVADMVNNVIIDYTEGVEPDNTISRYTLPASKMIKLDGRKSESKDGSKDKPTSKSIDKSSASTDEDTDTMLLDILHEDTGASNLTKLVMLCVGVAKKIQPDCDTGSMLQHMIQK